MSPGGFNVGGVVSTTVIVNKAAAVFPWASVAEQVTVVTPSGNVEPDAGIQGTLAIGPSRLSTAVGGRKFAFEPLGAFASLLMFAGTSLSTGFVVSIRVITTLKLACPLFP